MAILALHQPPIQNSNTPSCASASNPVDLVHLSRQTLGNRELEQEVLALFLNQTNLYLDRLDNSKTADERKMAAHTILGSARGIGAWRVAEEAAQIQQNCANPCNTNDLADALKDANDYIRELLS